MIDEALFLQRCIRCLHCVQSCPTEIIRPTGLEAGSASLFTPRLDFSKAGCDYHCQVCQTVCPNAAIPLQALEQKQRSVIGLASIDETTCVVFAEGKQCLVCEELCPIPEKAIVFGTRPPRRGRASGGPALSLGGAGSVHRLRHLPGQLPRAACRDHGAKDILTREEAAPMAKAKLSIHDLSKMKQDGEKVSWLTAYDFPTARFAEEAGLDMLLVGDSLGMCVYGYEGTVPVTMDQCIVHCQAVRRGAPRTFVIGDMPFMSYQKSDEDAVANAGRFLKESMVDAVKLEGGRRVITRIRAILDAGMVVCGHIGLTPQSSGQLGGHKAQGRTAESAQALIEDALAIEEAGAQLLLLEAVPPEVAGFIARRLTIPVYGIGAGPECDGQLLIVSDMIGQFQAFTPKFVKKYADVAGVVTAAMKAYVQDVKQGAFPADEHCYHMLDGEKPKFDALAKRYGR